MFFGNISQTWELMGQSWDVLKQDKELLIFPLVSGLYCLLVIASFAIPSIMSDSWMPPAAEQEGLPADLPVIPHKSPTMPSYLPFISATTL